VLWHRLLITGDDGVWRAEQRGPLLRVV